MCEAKKEIEALFATNKVGTKLKSSQTFYSAKADTIADVNEKGDDKSDIDEEGTTANPWMAGHETQRSKTATVGDDIKRNSFKAKKSISADLKAGTGTKKRAKNAAEESALYINLDHLMGSSADDQKHVSKKAETTATIDKGKGSRTTNKKPSSSTSSGKVDAQRNGLKISDHDLEVTKETNVKKSLLHILKRG